MGLDFQFGLLFYFGNLKFNEGASNFIINLKFNE